MKFFLGLCIFVTALFAVSQSEAVVVKVDGDIITLDREYVQGVSGIVVHSYNERHSAIVAAVVSLGGDRVKVIDASYVVNTRLPDIATPVRVGDKAVMGYLYNRSLLITPSEATYRDIQKIHPNIDFVNPDLLAFQMMQERRNMPTRQSIKEYCNQNAIGLVYIVAEDKGYLIDVNSFEILNVETIDSSGDRLLPFFMRLESLDGGLFGFFSNFFGTIRDDILNIDRGLKRDYDRYYLHMVGESK